MVLILPRPKNITESKRHIYSRMQKTTNRDIKSMTINMRIKEDEKSLKARSRKRRRKKKKKHLISTSPSKGTRDLDTVAFNLPRRNRLKRSKVGFENDTKLVDKKNHKQKYNTQCQVETGISNIWRNKYLHK